MNILVTGAAGYIGSIVTRELVKGGHSVVALDNLEAGHKEALHPQAIFTKTDLRYLERLDQIFIDHPIDAVIHLAANSLVGESMADPQKYFHTNLFCGIHLLDTMLRYDVKKLIFSSTAAIYGTPDRIPITENQPIVPPLNTYGETKLMLERLLHRYGDAYDFKFVSLRFFNAAGSSNGSGEDHRPETHLIPNVIKVALGQSEYIEVFGNDYSTKDGTCVRDYIHVFDIAKAHILALEHLANNSPNKFYNLGISRGYSVHEVINVTREITGCNIPTVFRPRRSGDPPVLVASSDLVVNELGWKPQYTKLEDIVESAWNWHREHPYGYSD
ncbi:MAG: UDP-glucose 4-epimerase GalE [Dehalococcoidia bacterium]